METLITVYWVSFGLGVVYIVVTGALGMVSHSMEGVAAGHGDVGLDHGGDFDAGSGDGSLEGAQVEGATTDGGSVDAHAEAGAAHFEHAGHVGHAGHTGHVEHGAVIASHDVTASQSLSSFAILSPLNLAGFLAAFGGTGLLTTYLGLSAWLGMGIALLGGAVMVLLLWLIIGKWLFGMQGTSQAHQADMIGLEAEVLTPVEHEATGEIAYVLEGTRYTAPARLIAEGRVEQRQIVRIRKMVNNIVYVEEKKKLLA